MTQSGSDARNPLHPVSILPGRERWAVEPLLDNPALVKRLVALFEAERGVLSASASADSGRILVQFQPRAVRAPIRALLREFLALPEAEVAGAAALSSQSGSTALALTIRAASPELRTFAAPVALTVAAHVLHLLQGNAFVRTVNRARLAPGTQGSLVGPLSFSLLLTGADLLAQYYRRRAWRRAGQAVRERLRAAIVAQLLRQDPAFFDGHGTGQLMDLAIQDVDRIGELFERFPDQVIEKSITALYAVATLVRLSSRLAAVATLPLPLLLLPSLVLGATSARRYARAGALRAQFTQTLDGVLSGMTDVRLFQAEAAEARRVNAASTALSEAVLGAASVSTAMGLLTQAIGAAGFGQVALYGASLVRDAKVTPEDFARVLYIYPMLLGAVGEVDSLIATYHDALGAARRLATILGSEPRIRSGALRMPRGTLVGEVTAQNISFQYQHERPVLRDVSFTLRPGEMVAVVGRTGSGKSTLLRLLARLYDVNAGRILLDGREIRDLDLHDLRAAVVLVTQDTYLFDATVRENLLYGNPAADERELLAAMEQAGALDLIRRLPQGLDTPVGERGARLSGGERQRVAIARAILRSAPLLLLDEITSHLDYETEYAIQQSVEALARDRTVVAVTHRLAIVRSAARIIVLEQGAIAEAGSHQELLAQEGIYAHLWRLQSGG